MVTEIDPVLFVDQALALKHNGGPVFTKIQNYWTQGELQEVLDANLREDWEFLVGYSSDWARHIFLNWLIEEDEVEVEGFETSRPRPVISGVGSYDVGAEVQMSWKAKTLNWRGEKGIILQKREVNKSRNSTERVWDYLVKISTDYRPKWVREGSINPLTVIGSVGHYEYIEEEIDMSIREQLSRFFRVSRLRTKPVTRHEKDEVVLSTQSSVTVEPLVPGTLDVTPVRELRPPQHPGKIGPTSRQGVSGTPHTPSPRKEAHTGVVEGPSLPRAATVGRG